MKKSGPVLEKVGRSSIRKIPFKLLLVRVSVLKHDTQVMLNLGRSKNENFSFSTWRYGLYEGLCKPNNYRCP